MRTFITENQTKLPTVAPVEAAAASTSAAPAKR